MTMPSLNSANLSRAEADRMRAEWLLRVHDGTTTVTELIRQACAPGYHPLLRIPLVRLLADQDGWGRARAFRTINRTLALLGKQPISRAEASRLPLQWLLDARSGGRRCMALSDAARQQTRESRPWTGWPYLPEPAIMHEGE